MGDDGIGVRCARLAEAVRAPRRPARTIVVAAIGIAALGFGAVPPTALDAVLLCTAAIVTPIVFDLVLVDLGRSLHCDPSDWRTALVVFVTALVVLLSSSRQQSQREARGDATSHRLAPQAGSGRAG